MTNSIVASFTGFEFVSEKSFVSQQETVGWGTYPEYMAAIN